MTANTNTTTQPVKIQTQDGLPDPGIQRDDHTQTTEELSSRDLQSESIQVEGPTVTLTPHTNLYTSHDGWILVVSLPQAHQSQIVLETEGAALMLSVPHQIEGIYKRSIQFPEHTIWGELTARWEDDLLYVELNKAIPLKRAIAIS